MIIVGLGFKQERNDFGIAWPGINGGYVAVYFDQRESATNLSAYFARAACGP